MHSDSMKETTLLENQLLLYIGDEPPGEDWRRFASDYSCEMIYEGDLLTALGAFVMLMPGIVVIDRRSTVGSEALSHIESVLNNSPQPLLILIELGVPDLVARDGHVVRLGAAFCASPACILSRLHTNEEDARR